MNKKFSTLLASALLMSAFSAGAQTITGAATEKYEAGKSYLLGNGSVYLTVGTVPGSSTYGQLSVGTVADELEDVNAALWTVSITPAANGGAPKFTFVNKATGLPLSVDYKQGAAWQEDGTLGTAPVSAATLGGAASEWYNGVSSTEISAGSPLMSYFSGDSVVYFGTDGKLYREVASKVSSHSGVTGAPLAVQPYQVKGKIALSALDLNTKLRTLAASAAKDFNLSFNQDVTAGEDNIFTATSLTAVGTAGEKDATPGYVQLKANGKKVKDAAGDDVNAYIVVDTAYFTGTENAGKLIKFTYANSTQKAVNNVARLSDSYLFKFSYDPTSDSLFIQSKAYVQKGDKDFADANGGSYWNAASTSPAALTRIHDAYIRLGILGGNESVRVMTLAGIDGTNAPSVEGDYINTKVTATVAGGTYIPTSLAEGLYLIKLHTSGYDENGYVRNDVMDGDYLIANLKGSYGYIAQAKNQDFDHMPAAQWYVKKSSTSATAPVTIYNREFDDQNANNPQFTLSGQLFKAGDNVFFAGSDTLEFIPVSKESAENNKLGYKYVSEDDTKVERYTFNYLSGLADDKYLYVPAGKDSIVRVDENGQSSNFRLEIVAKDDKYGYADSLVRNVYRIYDDLGRSLGYDSKLKKYVFSEDAWGYYFLKENNDKEGKHYYAILPANVEWTYDDEGENGHYEVVDHAMDIYDASGSALTGLYYTNLKNNGNSTMYADSKISVDDNTLDLLSGNINDKFDRNEETRTSAFAVEVNDAPLYRRFNNVALGESATDSTQNLAFVENVRGEYLMDEQNPNLKDENVNYVGIWDAEKAGGKLFFHVDTAWVNRGLGYIKPQYLISVARDDQGGVATEPCTEAGPHIDANGHITDDPYQCVHANRGRLGFVYGKYMVNFSDSAKAFVDREADYNPYTIQKTSESYTRVGFVPAIKPNNCDSLVILTNGFEKMEPADLDTATIFKNYRENKLTHFIVDLTGDKHKNVTWSFRYVNPETAADVTEEGEANAFLFESNVYSFNTEDYPDNYDNTYRTVIGDADRAIAPTYGAAWLKMQNGCLVLTDNSSEFATAKTANDGALIFNVNQMSEDDEFVTDNEDIAVEEGVSVIAGNGEVTIQGAAGKTVVITNILGKAVANTVLTSDNQTIAVPAGVVAVAVEGEEAVKAIVK